MQAMLYTRYGGPDNLHLGEVETPTPKAGEVLVKVHAAGLNPADLYLLRGQPFFLRLKEGLWKPKHPILGSDIAGQVVAVGRNVTDFQPGDGVFGDLSGGARGGFAEYVAAPAPALAHKPAAVPDEIAAAAPMASVTALQGLRDNGHIRPGERVLINGASGGVGTFAVQLAKFFGAQVTAVCSSRKAELVRGLGADRVIDYTTQDFTQTSQPYDLIFDTVGNRSLEEYRRALAPKGRFVSAAFLPALMMPGRGGKGGQSMRLMVAKVNRPDLEFIGQMLGEGRITAAIDRRYPLAQLPDALRYLAEGRAAGKVVITVAGNGMA